MLFGSKEYPRASPRLTDNRRVKAVRVDASGGVAVVDLPEPRIGAGEALMRTRVSGICGSDLLDWYVRKKAGSILGHEVAGELVAVGPGVTSLRAGDRIVPHHHAPCLACPECAAGRYVHCDAADVTASNFNLPSVKASSQRYSNLIGCRLERQRASHGTTGSIECCENAVTSCLDQSPAMLLDHLLRKFIVLIEQSTPCLIADCRRAARRIDDIGKKNGS